MGWSARPRAVDPRREQRSLGGVRIRYGQGPECREVWSAISSTDPRNGHAVSHSSHAPMALAQPESWWVLAVEGQETSPLAAAPLAMSGFFAGWIAVGVVGALRLARRGHDRRTMVAVGAGLSPLMVLLASDLVQGAALALHPGTLTAGADRFTDQAHRTLVLFAIGESQPGPASQGPA